MRVEDVRMLGKFSANVVKTTSLHTAKIFAPFARNLQQNASAKAAYPFHLPLYFLDAAQLLAL
jgi:hypothetical protein